MYIVVQFRAVRSLDIPPPPDPPWWGGFAVQPEKFAGAPHQASESNVLRQRCDARGFKSLPIEIIARRKVAPAFEPQRDRRAGSPNAKRGHDTGPERGPSLHVQGSVWRSWGSSLTLGTQAPDDRMEGFDPDLPFRTGPRYGWRQLESGRRRYG
jgi:hypothetical protein